MQRCRHASRNVARTLLTACVLFTALPPALGGQVVEMTVGASSYSNSYGTTANFWGNSYSGWFGLGVQDGFRITGKARWQVGRDTLFAGLDIIPVRYPTDIFGLGYYYEVKGAGWQATRGRFQLGYFLGATASGLGVLLAPPTLNGQVFSAASMVYRASNSVRLYASMVNSTRQTFFAGAEWRDSTREVLATTVGVGANRPFGAVSFIFTRERFELRASYNQYAPGYRRADLPTPALPYLEGPAATIIFRPRDWLAISATRQTFVNDSGMPELATRATGTSVMASAQFALTTVALGAYRMEAEGYMSYSSFASVGHIFGQRVSADLYVLGSQPRGLRYQATPALALRERVNEIWSLTQLITASRDHKQVSFGGMYAAALADIGVSYQIVYAPYETDPFIRTLNLTLRINVGSYRANILTTLLPNGKPLYDARAATFLYLGGMSGGPSTSAWVRMEKYIVRGIVTDQAGTPIAGAAVSIGGNLEFTDSEGRFFRRVGSRKPAELRVSLGEFLVRGNFEIVSAPASALPEAEEQAKLVVIVLRLVR